MRGQATRSKLIYNPFGKFRTMLFLEKQTLWSIKHGEGNFGLKTNSGEPSNKGFYPELITKPTTCPLLYTVDS